MSFTAKPKKTPVYSFTRPTDTTAYASGDLIANSTTVGSVVPMSWHVSVDDGGSGVIKRARIYKSSTGLTGATFRLWIFTAAPTVATNGDNGAITIATGAASLLARVDMDASGTTAMTDGVAQQSADLYLTFRLAQGGTHLLYGLLEARGAYAPGNGETISTVLEVWPD